MADKKESPPEVRKLAGVEQTRAALEAKQVELARAEDAVLGAAKKAPEAATKSGSVLGGKAAEEASVETATKALEDARRAVKRAEEAYHEARKSALPATPEEELRRLDTGVPLVLLPVRIETRFSRSDARFLVRVYPDEIFSDGHEPELTPEELGAGERYWRAASTASLESEAWRALTLQFSAPRAAWIVRTTQPAGEGADGRPVGAPRADVPTRPSSWNRAALARALPDRWVLVMYVRGERRSPVFGPPIRPQLALTVAPRTGAEVTLDGVTTDAASAWLTDFERARDAGMAFSLMADADMLSGIDRLLVFGVRSTLDPLASAAELERLFDAHHYHSGLAFVPQGTPTTSAQRYRSGFPPKNPAESFRVERRYGPRPDGDGRRFATMLGVRDDLFDRVADTELRERDAARAMMTALWPATLGYWLEVMMDPLLSEDARAELREYATAHVQGRGPLPAFRVGRVPYGVLPVTPPLETWKQDPKDPPVERYLVDILRRLRPFWRDALLQVPAISRSSGPPGPDGPDPDGDVFRVLTLLPSSVEIRRRLAFGGQVVQQALDAYAAAQSAYWREHFAIAHAPLRRLGITGTPRLAAFVQANLPQRIDLPLVEAQGAQPADYVARLRSARADALQRDDLLPPTVQRPWLYRFLRHALLLELRRVARAEARRADPSRPPDPAEPELVDIPGAPTPPVELLQTLTVASTSDPALRALDGVLATLGGLGVPELERLFTETLDVCSHRLDAWVTAVATRRIEGLREARPRGVVLGAWAWVEGIWPDRRLVDVPGARGVYRQTDSPGHIHAPSIDQAAAAAILRNAYTGRYGTERDAVAVDLSPRRVRQALGLLEGARQGNPLAALLGQQVERGLRNRGLQYMRFVDPLRRAFPLTVPITPEVDAPGPRERIAPRDVVDGLALHRERSRALTALAAASPTDQERRQVEAELDLLAEAVDAVSDLLTAESAFQAVKGQASVAGASLDALSRGERPPDPEVIRTPRSGRSVTHRVIVRLDADTASEAARAWGEWEFATPRASASRVLEAWLDALLGAPATIGCPVHYEVQTGDGWEPRTRQVTVAELGLRAVDLLALLREDDISHPASEIQLRLAAVVRGAVAGSRGHRAGLFERSGPPTERRTIGEALALLRTVRSVLTRARPVRPEDLYAPHAATGPLGHVEYVGTTTADVQAQRAALESLGTELDVALNAWRGTLENPAAGVAAFEGLLRRASLFGIDRAFPAFVDGAPLQRFEVLRAQAQSARAEAGRRVAASASIAEPVARAKTLFGEDFLLLSPFGPAAGSTLARAFNASGLLPDPNTPWKWLQQSARVRPAVHALGRMLTAMRTQGASWAFDVAQLPYVEGAAWAGWYPGGRLPQGEVTSLAVLRPAELRSDHWAAVLIDEWPERIPSAEEVTGVALHYNNPGAEAAQAILVVAPPGSDTPWSVDLLERTLWDTLELARLRAVAPDMLGTLGQYLPALFLAENLRNQTVSTNLTPHVRGEPSVRTEP